MTVRRQPKAAHIISMTASIATTPSEQPDRTHSLSAINNIQPGSVLALGPICALRTESGWLIAGIKGERPTWDLIRRSGTTTGTILRQGL